MLLELERKTRLTLLAVKQNPSSFQLKSNPFGNKDESSTIPHPQHPEALQVMILKLVDQKNPVFDGWHILTEAGLSGRFVTVFEKYECLFSEKVDLF